MAASSLALKHLVSRSLLSRSLRPLRAVTPPRVPVRSFSTTASGYDSDNSDSDDGRRTDPRASSPSSGNKFHPSSTTKANVCPGGDSSGYVRELWKGKETFDGLYLRFDMPGVGKENIKVWVEKDWVIMVGEGQKDFEYDEFGQPYNFRIQLVAIEQYNTDGVKANMVNGVLKVFVPKFKLKERTNLLHVTVF